jgi:hypothetical protein
MVDHTDVAATCMVHAYAELSLGIPIGAEMYGRMIVTSSAIILEFDGGTDVNSIPLGGMYEPAWSIARYLGYSRGIIQLRWLDEQRSLYLAIETTLAEARRIHSIAAHMWHSYHQYRAARPPLAGVPPSPPDFVHAQIQRYMWASQVQWGQSLTVVNTAVLGQLSDSYQWTTDGLPVHVRVASTVHSFVVEVVVAVGYGVRLDQAPPDVLLDLASVADGSSALLRIIPTGSRCDLVATSVVAAHPLQITDLDYAVRTTVARAKASQLLVARLHGVPATAGVVSSSIPTPSVVDGPVRSPGPDSNEWPLPRQAEVNFLRVVSTVESLGATVTSYVWSAIRAHFAVGDFVFRLRPEPVAVVTIQAFFGDANPAGLSPAVVWELTGPPAGSARLACQRYDDPGAISLCRSADVALCEMSGNNIKTTMALLATPDPALDSLRARLGCH